MQTIPVQLSDVIYNASNQSYEALVTVYEGKNSRKYACSLGAPITMSFQDAASGLRTQALGHHRTNRGMYSQSHETLSKPQAGRTKFDPIRWLEQLINLPGNRAT